MHDTHTAAGLHAGLVDLLRSQRVIRTAPVDTAMSAVLRHAFLPGVALDAAYAPDAAVVTKTSIDGAPLSSASAPRVVATMLEQLDVQPGDRILEIGAGTGYNAALLSELTGPAGSVTTIDLDQDIVDAARHALTTTGHDTVRVVCGDGELGDADHAPYDKIIVTVGAWDLPRAWLDQLAPDGRLVVPLRIHNATNRTIAFVRTGGSHLVSRSMHMCGFVPMRGIGGGPSDPRITLGDTNDIHLQLSGEPGDDTATRLADVLTHQRSESWTGVRIPTGDPFQQLDFWLALTVPGFCRLIAQPAAVADGRVTPAFRWGNAAVANADSLAYLTMRTIPTADSDDPRTSTIELGVCSHGPTAGLLHQRLTEQIRIWEHDHATGPGPRIEVHSAGHEPPTDQILINRKQASLAISWPTSAHTVP